MRKIIVAASLMGLCAVASAQESGPSPAEATQALQSAMQKEIQAMSPEQAASAGIDMGTANNVVRTLQVKSVNNCKAPAGGNGVACDVRTSAEIQGQRREESNQYHFWRQAGKWEARLASAS